MSEKIELIFKDEDRNTIISIPKESVINFKLSDRYETINGIRFYYGIYIQIENNYLLKKENKDKDYSLLLSNYSEKDLIGIDFNLSDQKFSIDCSHHEIISFSIEERKINLRIGVID